MHAGALSQGNPHRDGTLGPSAVRPLGEMMPAYGGSGPWDAPRAATPDDIGEAVDGFVASARNAVEAGFDGVEVHAANGYLLDQVITDDNNQRGGEDGGARRGGAGPRPPPAPTSQPREPQPGGGRGPPPPPPPAPASPRRSSSASS